jgi:hypothetical protein
MKQALRMCDRTERGQMVRNPALYSESPLRLSTCRSLILINFGFPKPCIQIRGYEISPRNKLRHEQKDGGSHE